MNTIKWNSYSSPEQIGDRWVVHLNSLENTGPKSDKSFSTEQEAKDWVRDQVLAAAMPKRRKSA